MNIHKNARTTPHSRAEIARRVILEGQPPGAVAAAFGVCLKTVGKWVTRFKAGGIEAHAAVGTRFEVGEPVWGCEVFEQAGDEEARDFAELGHGVQREEDAQEGQQKLEHRRSMLSASGPVESGGLYRPSLHAR